MPNITADEIVTLRHKRHFIQFGGAKPNNPVRYGGQDAQYMVVEGVSNPEIGGVDPIFVHDPRRQGLYRLVGRSISAPDLPQATLLLREKHGSIPRQLTKIGCKFNLYEPTGACGDLSDFLGGWVDYVLIYSGALVTDKDYGNRSGWDSDDPIEDSLSLMLSDIYPLGALSFGEGASTQVDRNVVDIVYGSMLSCGDCSPTDDGSNTIYAVTAPSGAGSPGLPAEIIYTVNGGLTWSQMDITGFGATEAPVAIDIAGNYLIVVGDGAYFYALINAQTGAPGTFTKVTTGFIAANKPLDIYVVSPREIFFSAQNGYVYKCTSINAGVVVVSAATATTSDLYRVHGLDETIVCVGKNGAIIKSTNRGITWATTTTSPAGLLTDLYAIVVKSRTEFWVGSNFGRAYYTLNGGESWVELSFVGSGSGQIKDIVFVNDEVGYISFSNTTPRASLLCTWNGGADWTSTSPRVLNYPTMNYGNRIAFPNAAGSIAVNNVAIAGIAGNGVDGIILVGVAAKM
jgi:hypothetical protein